MINHKTGFQKNAKIGNTFAYIREINHIQPCVDFIISNDSIVKPIESLGTIEINAIADATPQVIKAIQRWMFSDSPELPIYSEEWMCLYCGSPQPLPRTHCHSCGAPRSWLLG